MSSQQRTVLIVDDSAEDRELYQRYLLCEENYSYTILEAELGEEGLQLWQQHQPDIILLDYYLPDLNGLEFLAKLPIQQSFLPVIILTRQNNEQNALQTLKAGAQDYLLKGQITPQSLCLAVNQVIEAIELRQQLQQRIEGERLIAQIAQQIHRSLNLDEILQTTVTQVRQFLQTDRVIVLRLLPDGNGRVIAESVGKKWEALVERSFYDPCLAEKKSSSDRRNTTTDNSNCNKNYIPFYGQELVRATSDIYNGSIERCYVELLAQFQVRANLVIPILQDKKLWGLLIAHHCRAPHQWQAVEIDLLQKLSIHLAIALKQTQLLQQTQQKLAERQQAEKSLRESEARLRLAMQVTGFALARIDYASNTVELSPEAAALYGLPPDELVVPRQRIYATFHPEERAELIQNIEALLDPANSGWFACDHRVVWSNGEIRWLTVRKQVFFAPTGNTSKPTHGILVALDITERKHAELQLQQNQEKLQLALEASRLGTWDWDMQTGLIQWSENLESLFGLGAGEFDGSYEMFLSCLHPEDRDRVLAAVRHSIDTGEDYDIEFRVVYPNGNIRWALSRGRVFYNRHGQPIRMAGNDLDITERKHIEAALKESEERFRELAENINAVFWIKEVPEHRVSYVSPAYERLWGLNPQELYEDQQAWLDYIHPKDREKTDQAFQKKAESGQFDEEYRLVLPDDRIRWVRDRCFPLKDAAGKIYRFAGIAEDVTARREADEVLKQSEEFKSRILDNSSDCIKLLDGDGRFLYINSGGMNLLEIEDLTIYINSVWTDFWQQNERTAAETALIAAKQGKASQFQGFCPTCKGKPKWWDVVVTPILNSEGQVIQILVISRDITKQKQAEEELRQSEERFRTLADNMSQFAWMADASGSIFWYNQRWFDYTGTTLEEMQGWGWQKVHHPAEVERVVEHFRSSIKQGELWEDTFPLLGKDGQYRWFLSRAIPIRDPQGKIIRWFGTNTDIDKLRQTEIDLRESEERYRSLAELIPQLVWTAGEDGRILDVNQRWSDFTGLTLEQIQTLGWQEIIHPEDVPTLSQHWAAALHSGMSYQAEGRMRRVDGAYLWHLHQAIPQKNERGEIVKWFGTATDIEVQKQLEIERDRVLELEQTARAEAEQANRIKDEFLAILSHELRSPLNPILGWVQLLKTQQFDSTRTAQGLAIIEKNVKLQTQLIDDLLDVAKILRGKLSLNAAPLNLIPVISSALETVRTTAVAKSILLESNLANIGQVSADYIRLQQVIWNLLSNAIKFTPEGGRVEIGLERVNNMAQVTVRDTGKGINPDFLPHIFEYFRQEDTSITRKYGGLGLGLAIVRHLVEAHGGTIAASSPGEGKGAAFTIELPLLNSELETKQVAQLRKGESDLRGIKVLCIDDEPDTLELLGILLNYYGATVTTVASASDFLSAIESFQPDILISDIGMPEIDGYTLLQQVRSLPPERGGQTPAIALTAFAGEIDRQKALSVGFQRHLAKPVEPDHLLQAVLAVFIDDRDW